MRSAYVDSSWLVALALGGPGAGRLAARLERFDRLLASNLLEAELRSALAREGVSADPGPLLAWVSWVHPNRTLGPEFEKILRQGYLRGADMWHLATALFLAPHAGEMAFLTLDRGQGRVARRLGFSS